jgi:hypothetical protein
MAKSELLVAIVSIHSVTMLDLRPNVETKLRDVVTSAPNQLAKEAQVHLIWKQRKDGTKELLCQMHQPRVYLIADVLWLWKEVVLTSMLPRSLAALDRCAHSRLALSPITRY